MEVWFTERQTKNVSIGCRASKVLHNERTSFQDLVVLDTYQFGRMLVLDGAIQTTVKDEFVYHEMITHVPLFTHPNPRNVLVIGGGDGGAVREILKHRSVESVDLVELDERVIHACKQFLPETSLALGDTRVKVIIADGIEFVKGVKACYDIAIVDSPDPVGPAEGLFASAFYENVGAALREDGILVAQTESPFYTPDLIRRVFAGFSGIFPIVRLYLAHIPTYPSGLWSFTLGSKKYDPLEVDEASIKGLETRYYSPEIHKAVFRLPRFVKDIVRDI